MVKNEARELAIKIVDAVQDEQCRLNKIDTVEAALTAYAASLRQQRDEWKERHRYRVQLYNNVMEILNEQRGRDLAQLTALSQERDARWIPVGERRPTGAYCRIKLRDGSELNDALPQRDGDWYWASRECFIDESEVTHWMPQPNAGEHQKESN